MQFDISLDHDAVVQALGAMHESLSAGSEVDHPAHHAARSDEAQGAVGHDCFARVDVSVVIHADGEVGCRVDNVEVVGVSNALPGGRLHGLMDCCGIARVVAFDDSRGVAEASVA